MELIIATIINFISRNKFVILHVISGMLLSILAIFSVSLSVIGILIGAAGKEVFDLITKRGKPEIKDFLATLFGGLGGIVLLLLFGFIV